MNPEIIEYIGWTASILFSFCGTPQALRSWRDGHSDNMSHLFLWMWFSGEVLTIIYVWAKCGVEGVLMFYDFINSLNVIVIIR